MIPSRRPVVFGALIVCLVAAVVLSIELGAVKVPLLTQIKAVLDALHIHWLPDAPEGDLSIIAFLRLPRIVAALLVGSTLGACGAVMQGLFRNPMASPEIMGVSAGGSLGAVIVITTGLAGRTAAAIPLAAITGALAAAFIIYTVASLRGGTSLLFIIIAGLAVSSLFTGVTSAVLMFGREHEVSRFVFWTMGGLQAGTWEQLAVSAPIMVVCVTALAAFARPIDLLALGEHGAASLGLNVEWTKRLLLMLCAVATGTATALSGPIGFIGLLVPHFFRFLLGPAHRYLIPASALGGGAFLILCDLLGRIVAPPLEIRVGIITAVIGSPYLVFLVVRRQLAGGGAS